MIKQNKYTISQQRSKCIGCGVCCQLAPDTWHMNEADGKSEIIDSINKKEWSVGQILETELSENLKAQSECPVKIIHIQQKTV
ncbi:MAG: ferredoxin [Spirochaetia bacterium]|nr:ferredoxin [Spirochaetia bacterium]